MPIKILVDRWKAKTPALFKKIQRVCFAFGTVGTAIAMAGNYYDWLPEEVYKTCGILNLLGIFIQFTREGKKNDY